MAKVKKRICLQVGSYKDNDGNERAEYRELGVILEFDAKTGGRFQQIKINAEALSPALAALGRPYQREMSSGSMILKLFDVAEAGERKKSLPAATHDGGPEDDIAF